MSSEKTKVEKNMMMKRLTSSCSKAIINKHNDLVGFSCFKDPSVNRARRVCLIHSKDVARIKFLPLLSLQQHRRLQPVLSSPDSQVTLETTETQPEQEIPSKTINVKFQLQKECSFGEHFFIVGDHPMLGSWDPENAIPLTWSEGHVWAVELDIPVGSFIQFKFILKASTGVLLWQPGPDRIFESRETENTVVVCENWEDAEHQKVIEEEPVADQDGPVLDSEMTIVAENSTTLKEVVSEESASGNGEHSLEKPLAIGAENISHSTEDLVVANADNEVVGSKGINFPEDEALDISSKNVIVADYIGYINKIATGNVKANLVAREGNSPVLVVPGLSPLASVESASGNGEPSLKKPLAIVAENISHPTEDLVTNSVAHECVNPVLVPGSSPLAYVSTEETMSSIVDEKKHGATEEAMLSVDEKNSATDASIGVNEASNDKFSELEEKQEPEGEPREEETTLVAKAEEEHLNQHIQEHLVAEEEQPDLEATRSNVLQSDVQWGRKLFDIFRFP